MRGRAQEQESAVRMVWRINIYDIIFTRKSTAHTLSTVTVLNVVATVSNIREHHLLALAHGRSVHNMHVFTANAPPICTTLLCVKHLANALAMYLCMFTEIYS